VSGPRKNVGPCSALGCEKVATCRGLCHTHYCRLNRNGSIYLTPFRERFERLITKTASCWIWGGVRGTNGYGTIKKKSKAIRAHRASYELFVGPIPDGMHVLHKCDNPLCVNPEHLFVGTHIDNMRDMEKKGRAKWIQENLMSRA
jgi:hypothetical protein